MIAAADCTGHGVPGALMTVLGNELLNQIIYEQNITRPDLILFALDLKLRVSLQKRDQETEINDGMELALCTVDPEAKQLQFAGAKSPLYSARNGELHEIKGSRAPIGGRGAKNKAFHLHTHNIEEGDVFYITTDGFQDQFSREGNRKFTAKRFRSLLTEISPLPLAEQAKQLEQTFTEWKGQTAQIDDVLVIGMKVI